MERDAKASRNCSRPEVGPQRPARDARPYRPEQHLLPPRLPRRPHRRHRPAGGRRTSRPASSNALRHLARCLVPRVLGRSRVDFVASCQDVHGLFGGGSNSWGNGDLLALVINGFQPVLEVTWFTVRVGMYVGWRWPLALVAYFYTSGWIVKKLMPDYRSRERLPRFLLPSSMSAD